MQPRIVANGKLGLKHTRNVAEISDTTTEGGRSDFASVIIPPTPNNRVAAMSLSPR